MADSTNTLHSPITPSPSLKEQAQQALARFDAMAHTTTDQMMADFDTLRRAVEQLP